MLTTRAADKKVHLFLGGGLHVRVRARAVAMAFLLRVHEGLGDTLPFKDIISAQCCVSLVAVALGSSLQAPNISILIQECLCSRHPVFRTTGGTGPRRCTDADTLVVSTTCNGTLGTQKDSWRTKRLLAHTWRATIAHLY